MIIRAICLLLLLGSLPVLAQEDTDAQQAVETKAEPEAKVDRNRERDEALANQIPPDQVKWLASGDSEFLVRFKSEETGQPLGSLMMVSTPMQTILDPGLMTEAVDYFPTVSWHVMAVHPVDISFADQAVVAEAEPPTATEPGDESSDDSEPTNDTTNATVPEQVSDKEWYEKQHKENEKLLIDRLAISERELLRNERGYVLVVSSYSASLVLTGIKEQKIKPRAVILLDINHPVKLIQQQLVSNLKDIPIPVLDIYHSGSMQLANLRKPLSKNRLYTQRFIPGVSADFKGSEMLLMRTIRGWLKKNLN